MTVKEARDAIAKVLDEFYSSEENQKNNFFGYFYDMEKEEGCFISKGCPGCACEGALAYFMMGQIPHVNDSHGHQENVLKDSDLDNIMKVRAMNAIPETNKES